MTKRGICKTDGVWLMLAGLFLFDPIIGFHDYLPDLMGYLLLLVGLRRLADFNDAVDQAWRGVRAMAWIGAAQIVAGWILHRYLPSLGNAVNPYERPVGILLCSFLVAVAKCAFLLPACKRLFRGCAFLAERQGGTAVLRERKGKTLCQRMAAGTSRFLVLSALLSVLPELAVLTTFEYNSAGHSEYPEWFVGGGATNITFDWYTYAELFRLFAGVILFVISLIWLIRFVLFWSRFYGDTACVDALDRKYRQEVATQMGMLLLRRLVLAFSCIGVGALFAASFRDATVQVSDVVHSQGKLIASYELLPGVICAAAVLVGLLCLGDTVRKRMPCVLSCLLLGGISVAQILLNARYSERFYPGDALYRADAYEMFLGLRLVQIGEALATLLVMGCVLYLLWQILLNCTEGAEQNSLHGANHSLLREMKKQCLVTFGLFAAAAVAQSFHAWLQLKHPWLWIVAFAWSVLAIGKLIFLLKDILEEVGYYCKHRDSV